MVTAMFSDRQKSDLAYQWLITRGYGDKEINVLMSAKTRSNFHESGDNQGRVDVGSHTAQGAATGGAVGTTIGAVAAAIAAIGTSIALPGLGLIVAGPIAAALAGAGAGAVLGGAVGGLIGMGIPESNAKAYEKALSDGGVVIGVIARNNADVEVIKKTFTEHGGENVVTSNCAKC
jgi:hypothetical protein